MLKLKLHTLNTCSLFYSQLYINKTSKEALTGKIFVILRVDVPRYKECLNIKKNNR